MAWNISESIRTIVGNASSPSRHRCAEFVRIAVQSGGNMIQPDGGCNASCYANSLHKYGFRVVFDDFVKGYGNAPSDKYTPQDGDIAVLHQSAEHTCGHIEMFVSDSSKYGKNFGKNKWISDYPGNTLNCYGEGRVIRIFRYTGETTNP